MTKQQSQVPSLGAPYPAHGGPTQQAALQQAVTTEQQRYPRIANVPMALTTGVGPGYSETYEPDDPQNPVQGKWNVQLRDPNAISNQTQWPSDVGLEAIHALQANDPRYQSMTKQFTQMMSPGQLADAHQAYLRDQKTFGTTEPFDKWLQRVQAQEYIRGGIFTDVIPNWVGPKGEGHYTPQETQLLDQIKGYLQGQG